MASRKRTMRLWTFVFLSFLFGLFQNCAGNKGWDSQVSEPSNFSSSDNSSSGSDPGAPTPTPAPSPNPVPTPAPAPTPPPSSTLLFGGFQIGQHFHRPVTNVFHKYTFARTHDNQANAGYMKWWIGDNTYNFAALDGFRDFHKANGAKVLLTFYGSPQWVSARPNEQNIHYPSYVGALAEPRDLKSYGRMVQATVSRYKNDLYAVECWNEPFKGTYTGYDPTHAEFFSGTPTALADMCKELFINTKAVSPQTPVICPAEAYSSPIVVNSKTSSGEPLLKYCDMIGWHPYGWTGVAGVGGDLSQYVDKINAWTQQAGFPKMPIAITEWGVAYNGNVETVFQNMTSEQKADVLYQTLKMAYKKGVKAFAMYSYDDNLVGINSRDSVTASGITKAVNEFAGK